MSFIHQPEQLGGLKDRILARVSLLYGQERYMTTILQDYVGIDVSKDRFDVAVLG